MDTADKAMAALEAAGIHIVESAYRQYESGSKKPSRNHLPQLERYWGPVTDPLEATQPTDPVIDAIGAQTTILKGVLEAILARLPEPNSPVDPALQKEAERDWDGEERRAEQARGGTTSLPRKPSRGRPNAGRSRDRRSTEPTG